MSEYDAPNQSSPRPPVQPAYHDTYYAPPSSALAITSLVLAILGVLCLGPITAIPAIIVGAIAIKLANENPPRAGGKGMAIAGVIVGAVGTILGILSIVLLVAITLPAVGQARQSAQRLESSSNIRLMVQGIVTQSRSNNGQFPQTAEDWQQNLIDANFVPAEVFTSPYTDGLGDDYFFVPGGRDDFDASRVVVYEDPALRAEGTLIGFADSHVEFVDQQRAMQILGNLTLPDGTRYAPHESDPSASAAASPGGTP